MILDFRGMIREFYGEEKVRGMLGQEGASTVFAWAKTSMDGDGLEIRLGTRAVVQERVDIKQQMEGYQLGKAERDPITGMPLLDTKPQLEAIFRNLKLGKPQQIAPREQQLQQMLLQTMQQAKQLQEENDLLKNRMTGSEFSSDDGGSGKPGPKASLSPGQPAPENGAMNAGARRGTVSTGGRSIGG